MRVGFLNRAPVRCGGNRNSAGCSGDRGGDAGASVTAAEPQGGVPAVPGEARGVKLCCDSSERRPESAASETGL